MEITSLTIIGRRWHDKNGNAYHTAQIIINGETIHVTDVHYGYGSHYKQTAANWLELSGYMPDRIHFINGSSQSLYTYFSIHNGIIYQSIPIDVNRKKDLGIC